MSKSEPKRSAENFVAFPLDNLVAAFESVDAMNAVIEELTKNGFAHDEMRSFVGEEGMQQLDFDGSAHGSLAEMLRSLQHIGPDRTYLERYEKYMRDGDCVLMVHVPQKELKQIAADTIRKHSEHRVTYFGKLVIEEV